MSKELEALNKLAKQIELDENADFWEIKNSYKTVERALTELQSIKEAKPSEALESLEKLVDKSYIFNGCYESIISREEAQENNEEVDELANTIKQALFKAESCLGARRNGKTLEQMYQLVQYSKPPMKPALWVAKVDGKLEQRVIMEKEEYDKLTNGSKKARAWEVAKEKNVSIFWLKECKNLEEYNYNTADYMKLTQQEFDLLKEMLE